VWVWDAIRRGVLRERWVLMPARRTSLVSVCVAMGAGVACNGLLGIHELPDPSDAGDSSVVLSDGAGDVSLGMEGSAFDGSDAFTPCLEGTSCNVTPCQLGTLTCREDGSRSCMPVGGVEPNGTGCGTGAFCCSGNCSSCTVPANASATCSGSSCTGYTCDNG